MADEVNNQGGSVEAPPAATAESAQAGGQAQGASPDLEVVQSLYKIMTENPDLANKVADLIEQHFNPKAAAPQAQGAVPSLGAGAPGFPQQGAAAPGMPGTPGGFDPSMFAQMVQMTQAMGQRLGLLEQQSADAMLKEELNQAKQEYEKLKNEFPILPDLNDREIMQIALERNGLPLNDALYLWAVQKMREGEGSPADRIAALMMQKSAANKVPDVEGKGGSAPSGEAPPPTNFRQARRGAKELLSAMLGGVTGQ